MLIGPHKPLEIARSVLRPETITAIQSSPSFSQRGHKIIDRWAFNSPQQLRRLENDGEAALLIRLLEQQTQEQRAIDEMQTQGLADHEILAMAEIQTEL